MSPVSRGRKSKRAKKGRKPPASVTSSGWGKAARREFGVSASAKFSRPPDRYTQWWEPSHERVMAASGALLAAQGPRALEQATAELVGAELYDAVREERYGLRFDLWAVDLVDRAAKRIADAASRGDDSWQGPWWLLHGLASIGSYGLGGYAWEQVLKALPPDAHGADPEWLKLLPGIKATGDVRVMRDAYGTRFGVTAAMSYPGGVDPSVYLMDMDASELIALAGAGVFDDVDQAAAAWREQVGLSAEGLTPVPATPESLTCLVYCEVEDQHVMGGESRRLIDNWFRGPRRMHDVHEALQERGIALPEYHSLFHDIDVAPMTDPFIEWYSERHGHRPGREAVEALAGEWLEGMLPGTEHSVSPKRSEAFRGLIGDWLDDPITGAVLALLPEWVRWNGEQAGVPASLIERAVSAASAG